MQNKIKNSNNQKYKYKVFIIIEVKYMIKKI